jgi:DNA-binding MurR/RpiR family transcriptional regulator
MGQMSDYRDIEKILRSDRLTPMQKKLAEIALNDPETVALSTVASLAATLHMNESTIIRFVDAAGFDGFPDFRDFCRYRMRHRNGMLERFLTNEHADSTGTAEAARNLSARMDRDDIAKTFSMIRDEDWLAILSLVGKARRVGVIGLRQSGPACVLCTYLLGLIRDGVVELGSRYGIDIDKLAGFGGDDCIIAISTFPCSAATVRSAEWASKSDIPVIAIADEEATSLLRHAWKALVVETTSNSALSSMTSVFALIQALAGDIALSSPKTTAGRLEREEKIIRQFDAYAD